MPSRRGSANEPAGLPQAPVVHEVDGYRHDGAVVSAAQLTGLALACVLLLAVPGPSVVFIVGRALSYGRRIALASVAGNCLGCYLAAVCVALGLGPLLQNSEVLFAAVKLAGAGYLIWLGIQALRHAKHVPGERVGSNDVVPTTWQAVRAGALVGVSNPKAFIVFAAILPQFVDLAAGAVPAQMILLGAVPVLMGAVIDSAWGLGAGQARSWLASSPRRMTAAGRVGGLSMVGLGVSVAMTGQRA